MNQITTRSSIAAACVIVALSSTLPTMASTPSVAEFTPSEAKQLDWRVVNDGVMGGLSRGKIEISNDGVLNFSGTLSLENNGGFSSIRTGAVELDLSGSEGLAARVRGDGRTYQLRLGTEARYRGMEVSFMAEFATRKGEWTEVRVPFTDFVGSFRGMTLKKEVFDPSQIRRVGLLLGDKKAGPFALEVDWIRAYAGNDKTVVDAALADGRFTTLAAALTEAGLVDVLKGEGPFTVFAPTDEAFAKLPKGTVETLLKPENKERLKSVLTYHVSPGATRLATALSAGRAATVQGGELAIGFNEGRIRVGEASVINADIECSNGVIHVIDAVLLPPAPTTSNDLLGVAQAAGSFKTLLAAVEAAGLTEVLQGEGPLTILAPTDEAFAKLPGGTVESLLKKENLGQLKAILTYHAIPGAVSAGDALNAGAVKTVNGQEVTFALKGGLLQVNAVTIRSAGIKADNGIIHVIDAVLLPPAAKSKNACSESECADPVAPIARIEAAIDRGVPVFNSGNHAGCADIYESCLQVLAGDERVNDSVRSAMKRLLERTEGHDSDTDRAWIYRKTLDHVHAMLSARRS